MPIDSYGGTITITAKVTTDDPTLMNTGTTITTDKHTGTITADKPTTTITGSVTTDEPAMTIMGTVTTNEASQLLVQSPHYVLSLRP